MAASSAARRLIVTADDFGRSTAINAAVVRAHREGILTCASLMVNEPACHDAVALAHEHPHLGVGLHLSLAAGRAALAPEQIPGLADTRGCFADSPVVAGWRYFFCRKLRGSLQAEIAGQFARFDATGLKCDHVNGHLHLHLHPTILPIILEHAARRGINRLRLTRDPLRLNASLAGGRWAYRLSHAIIFNIVSRRAHARFKCNGIRHTDRVFGLLQDGRVNEEFLCRLLARLPEGDSELYSHPSLTEFTSEFEALVSHRATSLLTAAGIQLIRYQDL